MRTKEEVSETLGGCRGAELIINSEIKRNYNTFYPLCRKILKMMIWGVPLSVWWADTVQGDTSGW